LWKNTKNSFLAIREHSYNAGILPFSLPGYNKNMNFFVIYLGNRCVFRIGDFLRHWYITSGKKYANACLNMFERLDRTLAWKINILNIFTPLYKDYSLIGHVVGFLIRSLRFLVTSFIYAVIFICAAVLYIIWLLIPPYVVYSIFS